MRAFLFALALANMPASSLLAQTPPAAGIHNLMNLRDAYLGAVLRPERRVTIRSELHWLQLAERNDLWYAGGGAFDRRRSVMRAGHPGVRAISPCSMTSESMSRSAAV